MASGADSAPQTAYKQPSCRSRLDGLPATRKISERLLISGPFVKGGWIKVGSVRPHKCLNFRINRHFPNSCILDI